MTSPPPSNLDILPQQCGIGNFIHPFFLFNVKMLISLEVLPESAAKIEPLAAVKDDIIAVNDDIIAIKDDLGLGDPGDCKENIFKIIKLKLKICYTSYNLYFLRNRTIEVEDWCGSLQFVRVTSI